MAEHIPARTRSDKDYIHHTPVHVVWELTLACNLKCKHCGSRAGKRRPNELNTEDCLEIVEHLAKLGVREISLIGGEAFLRKDWIEIIRAIRRHGIYCAIQTGAWALTKQRLDSAIEAGLQGIGVSIDGLQNYHDYVRGVEGSFDAALGVLNRAKNAGLNRSVNTQIGPGNVSQLRELMYKILEAGSQQWQLQLTVAMGNAVDNEELILQPYELLDLFPFLAELYDEAYDQGMAMIVGNNIGYFGPYEHKFRSTNPHFHWTGCSAGQTVMGIEADGTIKGCPSLPTMGYAGGNVKNLSLEDIWNTSPEIHFGRLRSVDDLWGFCRSCYYAEVCKGGCTWTSHSLLGRPGNNPFCHFRALELKKKGLRERIRKVKGAAMTSFAVGRFELILEEIPSDGHESAPHILNSTEPDLPILDQQLTVSPSFNPEYSEIGRVPPKLNQCKSCFEYIWDAETVCPHCSNHVSEANRQYEIDKARREAIMNKLLSIMDHHNPKK